MLLQRVDDPHAGYPDVAIRIACALCPRSRWRPPRSRAQTCRLSHVDFNARRHRDAMRAHTGSCDEKSATFRDVAPH
jgi:hypothetical protein